MTDKPPASSPDAVRSAWIVLESKYTFEDPWIRLRSDVVRLPNNKILSPYHTIEYPDWVNVIALTAEKNIILVEQYRHPVRQTFIEHLVGHPACVQRKKRVYAVGLPRGVGPGRA